MNLCCLERLNYFSIFYHNAQTCPAYLYVARPSVCQITRHLGTTNARNASRTPCFIQIDVHAELAKSTLINRKNMQRFISIKQVSEVLKGWCNVFIYNRHGFVDHMSFWLTIRRHIYTYLADYITLLRHSPKVGRFSLIIRNLF